MKERITLYDIEELSHVEDYETIVSIRSNNYFNYNVKKFHALLLQCVNLEELHFLNASNLTVFPPEILTLSKLHTLIFTGACFDQVPSEIKQLKALSFLAIRNQTLSELPIEISQLTNLKELDLSNTTLGPLLEDLECLKNVHSLRHLNLFRLKQKKVPAVLPYLTQIHELFIPKALYNKLSKKHASFCQEISYVYSHSDLEKKYANSILNICRKNHYNWNFRSVLLNLLADDKEKLAKLASYEAILKVTDVKLQEIIRLKALEYLGDRWGAEAGRQLQQGAIVAVIGKLGINKRELNKKLKEQGIKYSAKITDKTTHLILGQLPKGAYQEALDRNIPILPEQIAIAFTDTNSEQYLVDDLDSSLEQAEQLSNLLLSGQDENILLALTLFKQGGFPKDLLTELFLAAKHSSNKEVVREAERLIRQYGSIALVDEFKKGTVIFHQYASEAGISRKLIKLGKTTELDPLKMAWYGFTQYQKSVLYLLKILPSKEKLKFLQQLVIKGELKLSNIGLSALPSEMFALKGLKHLDLSYNYQLASLPKKLLGQLKELETINLKGNYKIKDNLQLLVDLGNNYPTIKLLHL